jgi:mannose-1-phosphate guanylyltransferase
VNAMILAAGLGTRLGSLSRTMPKVLLDVGGEPLLARHLAYLARNGIKRVVLNAHHLAEQIQEFVEHYDGPLELVCVVEDRLLGTAGGVRNALPLLEPGPFVVLYGDVLIDEALSALLATHRRSAALATLAVHRAENVEGKGVVRVDATGRVTGFLEKPAEASARALINSGMYILETDLVATLPCGMELDFGQDVFPRAVERKLRIFAHTLLVPAIDIGTPEGLAQAQRRAGDGQ